MEVLSLKAKISAILWFVLSILTITVVFRMGKTVFLKYLKNLDKMIHNCHKISLYEIANMIYLVDDDLRIYAQLKISILSVGFISRVSEKISWDLLAVCHLEKIKRHRWSTDLSLWILSPSLHKFLKILSLLCFICKIQGQSNKPFLNYWTYHWHSCLLKLKLMLVGHEFLKTKRIYNMPSLRSLVFQIKCTNKPGKLAGSVSKISLS